MKTHRSFGIGCIAIVALVGCGEASGQAPSASAAQDCKDTPARYDEARCKDGTKECCARLVAGKSPDSPASLDLFGAACAGGHTPACDAVYAADRPAQWKLDVLTKACAAGVRERACRAEMILGAALEPEKLAAHFTSWCAHTNNEPWSGAQCPDAAGGGLDALKAQAGRCAAGAFEACDFEGMTSVLRPLALAGLARRGLDAEDAAAVVGNRLATHGSRGPGKGGFAIAVSPSKRAGAKALDPKLVKAGIAANEDALRKCVGLEVNGPDTPGGWESFDVIVDDQGVIVATVDMDFPDAGAPGFAMCARESLQDMKIAGITSAGRAHVELKLKP